MRTTSPPPLSIVVPSHETRDLTLACLAALGRAGTAAAQVILVDDGSRDGTAAAVGERFPAVEVIRHDVAQGFTRSANSGLARARGELLLLLNADTEVDPGGLDRLLAAFAERPALGVAGAVLRYPDGRPQWSAGPSPSWLWLFAQASGWPARLGALRRRNRPGQPARPAWVSGAAIAFRRRAWERCGPLEERFTFYAQDLDFCLRASAAGFTVDLLPEFGVLHHHGAAIGQQAAATSGRAHLAHLWADLARWAALRKPPLWARGARLALLAGAGVQWLTEWLRAPLSGPAGERDRAAIRRGITALLVAPLPAPTDLLPIPPTPAPRGPRP